MAIAASLFHVLNHAVFKGLLFLGAGSVVMATGTRQIEADGRPVAADAVDGAVLPGRRVGDLGLPLLNGFVSEWLIFQALLLGFAVRRPR